MTVNQRVVCSSQTGGANTAKGFKQLKPFFIYQIRHISDTKPI